MSILAGAGFGIVTFCADDSVENAVTSLATPALHTEYELVFSPSSSNVLAVTLATRTAWPSSSIMPSVTSKTTMSPFDSPCAVDVATPGFASVTAVTVRSLPSVC